MGSHALMMTGRGKSAAKLEPNIEKSSWSPYEIRLTEIILHHRGVRNCLSFIGGQVEESM
jgi:hypothetical protein